MRTISYFTDEPSAEEVIQIGGRSTVFIRKDIEPITEETDGEERTYWQAVEYSTQVNTLKFSVTEEFIDQLIEAETQAEAERVRDKRNELLDKTDKEMTVDRIERETPEKVEAWKIYRQALRDVPEQEGFPFDVIWPEKPM